MKIKWSPDLLVYALMILMGVFVWYIGFFNEKSKLGKILATVGISLFVVVFIVLFLLKLFTVI